MNDPLMPPERGPKKTTKPASPAAKPVQPAANPPPPQTPPPGQPLYVARAVSVPKPQPVRPVQQAPVQPPPTQAVPKATPAQPTAPYPQAPPQQQVPAARPVPMSAPPVVQPAQPSFPVAQAAPPRAAPAPSRSAPAASQNAVPPIDGQQFHWEMQRTYAGIRPWLWFIGIVGLLTGMLMLSGVCVVLYATGGQMVAPVVIACLVILVTATVVMYASYFMFRYASRIGEYLYGGSRYWLEMTLDAERSMWRFYGVLAILLLVISIMAIVMLLAGSLVAAGMGVSSM